MKNAIPMRQASWTGKRNTMEPLKDGVLTLRGRGIVFPCRGLAMSIGITPITVEPGIMVKDGTV